MWIIGGVFLGIIIHLVVILILPTLASDSIWKRITRPDNFERVAVLDDIGPGEANPLHLDPEFLYGVCRLDLRNGVGILRARLPMTFWSVAVFDTKGHTIYGTTNRSGSGQSLKLGIFDPEQIRMLAEQKLDVEEGLLIIEAGTQDVFVVIRLVPPHQAMRARYRQELEATSCQSQR